MILEMPKILEGIGYYEGLSLILWFIAAGLFFLSTFLFIRRARIELRNREISYITYIAFGFFSLGMGLVRIFFIMGVYFSEFYDYFTILGYVSGLSGLIYWLYVIETHLVKKTKKFFTIISIIMFCISLISLLGVADRYLALQILYILLPFSAGIVLIMYIYLIIKTTGTVRKKVIGILVGLSLLLIAQILDGEAFISTFPSFPFEIAPIIMMTGIILFVFTQLYY